MSAATSPEPPATASLLFYKQPEALNPQRHGNLRLKKDGDFAFARGTNSVAITSTEFISAMRSYPIVFAAGTPHPLVVLGLEQENAFVEPSGRWRAGHYVPAYIRRYPFVFIAHPDGKQFVLGIDRASGFFEDGGDGRALFENNEPSEVAKQGLAFCSAFQSDHGFTTAFGAALEEQNLLIDNQAQVQLHSGRSMNLRGFRVVDRQKFSGLSDVVVADWHKKGWLALVHYHLASLERFTGLLEMQGVQKTSA